MLIFDAHVHLSGSVSDEYLLATAEKNQCQDAYSDFKTESDVWKKFGHIHRIIQTTEDITAAAIDVVAHSDADIMEIRTTPRSMQNKDLQAYIDAFVAGLSEAKALYPKKNATGLLSIDRTQFSLAQAKWLVDAAVAEKSRSGMIVGIDLSGNFNAPRLLTGNDLYELIDYALKQDIGLALHVGEVDSAIEAQDFDLILAAIQAYQQQTQRAITGKVRLGHAIFRSPEQDTIIQKLEIPIEVCPASHQHLKYWEENNPHPVSIVYPTRGRIISGTDDPAIFVCTAKQEQETVDELFPMEQEYAHLSNDEQNEITSKKRLTYMFDATLLPKEVEHKFTEIVHTGQAEKTETQETQETKRLRANTG